MSETYVFVPERRFEVQVYRNGRWITVASYSDGKKADAHRDRLDPPPTRPGYWVPKARVADMKGR